jgi:hypothetical protein
LLRFAQFVNDRWGDLTGKTLKPAEEVKTANLSLSVVSFYKGVAFNISTELLMAADEVTARMRRIYGAVGAVHELDLGKSGTSPEWPPTRGMPCLLLFDRF